jgi:hypothetical protein
MTPHIWWVPLVVVYYVVYSWLSKQNNDIGGKWLWMMFVWGAICPMWIIVSRISKNLLFDGMLYDNLMFLTYVGTMMYLGSHAKLAGHQWFGLGLVVFGSVLMRIEMVK